MPSPVSLCKVTATFTVTIICEKKQLNESSRTWDTPSHPPFLVTSALAMWDGKTRHPYQRREVEEDSSID
jgi:hypothetical protein